MDSQGTAEEQARAAGARQPRVLIERLRLTDKANYLVQWNLPPGLTMETYLQRKAEKTPLYAQVPEVSFERT